VDLLWQIPLWLVGTALFDWVVAGRFAALAPSVDYRYWPLSKLRVITLSFLSIAVGAEAYLPHPVDWALPVLLVAFIIYGAAIMADMERQRERRPLPHASRYSEVDADY
jgi:hypothetical protein